MHGQDQCLLRPVTMLYSIREGASASLGGRPQQLPPHLLYCSSTF